MTEHFLKILFVLTYSSLTSHCAAVMYCRCVLQGVTVHCDITGGRGYRRNKTHFWPECAHWRPLYTTYIILRPWPQRISFFLNYFILFLELFYLSMYLLNWLVRYLTKRPAGSKTSRRQTTKLRWNLPIHFLSASCCWSCFELLATVAGYHSLGTHKQTNITGQRDASKLHCFQLLKVCKCVRVCLVVCVCKLGLFIW